MITNEELAAAIDGFKDGLRFVKLRRYKDGPFGASAIWTAYQDGIALAEAFIRNRLRNRNPAVNEALKYANMPDWNKVSP